MGKSKAKDERLNDRLVVLVNQDFKTELQKMYADIGLNMAEDTRDFWQNKLAVYQKSRK